MHFEGLHTIVALSYGCGDNVQYKYRTELKGLLGLSKGDNIRFEGFTNEERQKLISEYKVSVQLDTIEEHCGSNPLLLQSFVQKKNLKLFLTLKKLF